MRLLFCLFICCTFKIYAQKNRTAAMEASQLARQHNLNVVGGQVYRFELPFAHATRMVDVYIPMACAGKKGIKTLYMHDGQMLFDSTQTWNKQEWGVDELYYNKLGRYFHEKRPRPRYFLTSAVSENSRKIIPI